MAYSMVTLRAALKAIGVSKGDNPFVWEATKGAVAPQLAAHFTIQGKVHRPVQNFVNDLTEYCWLVYSKALAAGGPQLIGRTNDLWVTEHLEKAGLDLKAKQTLWDAHTKGNIQVMEKWAPTVNDCWVLGGVHRRANFELVSERSIENLWDFTGGRHVVTAREILGLLHFGYELEQGSARTRFVCRDPGKAQAATVEQYDSHMKAMEAKGPAGILPLFKRPVS